MFNKQHHNFYYTSTVVQNTLPKLHKTIVLRKKVQWAFYSVMYKNVIANIKYKK